MQPNSGPGASRFPPVERTLRLSTGLLLFSFATSHFLNHAIGILRLDIMEAVRLVLIWPWRTAVGQTLLYGSFFVHGGLRLRAIYRRRHLRIPKGELWQLLLGLSIPPLVIIHAVNVRLGHFLFDLDLTYPRVLYRYWILSPTVGLGPTIRASSRLVDPRVPRAAQLAAEFRTWYRERLPILAVLATLVPLLAVIGILDAGRDLDTKALIDQGFLAHLDVQTKAQSARLGTIADGLILGYLGLVAAVFALRGVRAWHERQFRGVTIRYPRGEEAIVPRGFSILEASRWAGIAHMSMCGGRGRCSTCRILVTGGLEHLPHPNVVERTMLVWIGAGHGVRLACQVRPRHSVDVVPLLTAQCGVARHRPILSAASEEREIAAFFIDLRNSTGLADGRLPYDAFYVIDRYISEVTRAIETHGGCVTSVAGDGIMCFFGAGCDPAAASRRAVLAIRDVWHSLALLHDEFETAFDFPLRFGAGCHLGLAVVGTLPGRDGTQFLGEVGNIAARLETLTKELGCTVILSRAVIERAGFLVPKPESHRVRIKNVTAEIEMVVFRSPSQLEEMISTIAA